MLFVILKFLIFSDLPKSLAVTTPDFVASFAGGLPEPSWRPFIAM